jgi:excisionase family DNA binding protein
METSQTLLSTGQAAKKLGVGKTKLLALFRTGRLATTMFDGRIRVRVADIDAFIDALPKGDQPGKIQLPPTPEQLAARNDPRVKKVREICEPLIRAGLVHDTGKRKWSEKTGQFEIVWGLTPLGKAVHRPSEVERLEDSDAIGGDGTGGRKAVRHG